MWKKAWWKYKKSPKSENKKTQVSFQLISVDRFAISFKNKDIEAYIRKQKSSKFDSNFNLWTLPLSQIDSFKKYLEDQNISFNDIPKEVYNVMKELNENENIDTSLIPKPLFDSLLPFQKRGVLFSISRNGKAFICDEMGLGKTIQAVAISCYYSDEWPLLIIAPSFLKEQWAAEYRKWLPDKALDVNIISTSKNWSISLINIVSYELITSLKDTLFANHNFNVIICDESHYLKSIDAQRTKSIVPILKKAKRRILLTGTPALSRPCELYSQLEALDMPIFSSFKKFALRYCNAYKGPYGWDYNGSSNLAELHSILRYTIMIRRMKNDVLTELPEKHRTLNYINADEERVKEIQENLKKVTPEKIKKATKNEFNDETMEKRSIFSTLYQETARAKCEATKKYIIDILENEPEDKKFIVFAYHIEMLDAITECLKSKNVSYIRIDGSTPIKNRTFLVDKFSRKNTRVAVLSITCASSGINLVSASMVIFAEIYWTPGILIQAEDRVHRIGQASSSVDIRYLLARNTLDDIIWPLIEKKLNVVGKTLNGQREKIDATKVEMSSLREIRPYILDCFSENNDHSTPKKRRRSTSPSKGKKRKKSTIEDNGQNIKDYFHIIEKMPHDKSNVIDLSNEDDEIIDKDIIDIDCTSSSDTHEIDITEKSEQSDSGCKSNIVYYIDSQEVVEKSDSNENKCTYNNDGLACKVLFEEENTSIKKKSKETLENDSCLNRFSNLNLANSLLNGKKLSKRMSESSIFNVDNSKATEKPFYSPQPKTSQRKATGQQKKAMMGSTRYPMLKLVSPTLPKKTVSLSLDKKKK